MKISKKQAAVRRAKTRKAPDSPAPAAPKGISRADLASVSDELPLWSAPFAQLLLEQVDLRDGMRFLDVGCGTGVPLLELAQRVQKGQAFGIDPWPEAAARLRFKAVRMGLARVTVKTAVAEKMPFQGGFFDLLVSNNGLNNVQDPARSLGECARVLKAGGRLVFTVNLPETMSEFYDALRFALDQAGRKDLWPQAEAHIAGKRQSIDGWKKALTAAGFKVEGVEKGRFFQYYSSSAALFGHFFIRQYFLPAWRDILPEPLRDRILSATGKRLDDVAKVHRGVRLTVPLACFTASKI